MSSDNLSSPSSQRMEPSVLLGIDFGNQKCVVGVTELRPKTSPSETVPKSDNADDTCFALPVILSNDLSNDQTPSIVSFKDSKRVIGEAALSQCSSNPATTFVQIKRLIGLDFDDEQKLEEEASRLLFKVQKSSRTDLNKPVVEVSYGDRTMEFTVEQLIAMLFSKMKFFLNAIESAAPECVISVPGSFTDRQVSCLLDSARIAGLKPLGVLNHNTAAALCYAATHRVTNEVSKEKTMLFIEMGHAYFGAELVCLEENQLTVLSSAFDDSIGGRVFDHALFDYAIGEFKKQTGNDLGDKMNPRNRRIQARLYKAAEKAKEMLSTLPVTELIVECVVDDKDIHLKVTRTLLGDLCKDLLERMVFHLRSVLEKAGLSLDKVDLVEIVGGGARLPIVQEKIKEFFCGKELSFHLDSAHCVALGAAFMAQILKEQNLVKFSVKDPQIATFSLKSLMSDEEMKNAIQLNNQMEEEDRVLANCRLKQHELESYLYNKRNQCMEDSYGSVINEQEKKEILQLLEEGENWIHSEGEMANFEVLCQKLDQLKDEVNKACPKLFEKLTEEEETKRKMALEAELTERSLPTKMRTEPRTKPEKINTAKQRKQQGNTLFKEGDMEGAIRRYTQALACFDNVWDLSPEEKQEIEEIKSTCYLNLAAVYLKLNKFEKVRDNCTSVLEISKENVKALFRRAQAFLSLKEYEMAKKDLLLASKIEPSNVEVKKSLKTVQDHLEVQKINEKKVYSKMFG